MFRQKIIVKGLNIPWTGTYKVPRDGSFSIGRQHQRGTKSSRDLNSYPVEKSKKKYLYTIGALVVGATGVIGYAKYDSEFRTILTENIPWSNAVINFIFEEEKPYMENINEMISNSQNQINQITSNVFGSKIEWSSPTSKSEETQSGKSDQISSSKEKVVSSSDVDAAKSAAQNLISAIHTLQKAVQDQARSINKLVDESVHNEDSWVFSKIKDIKEEKQKLVDLAEKNVQAAKDRFEKKRDQLADKSYIKSSLEDLVVATKALNLEKSCLAAALKFADAFEQSHNKIKTEMKTLFPELKIGEKGSSLTDAELDLFLLYAHHSILNVQKEIKKFDRIKDTKLQEVLERSNINMAELNVAILKELEKERLKFDQAFEKRKAEILEIYEKDLIQQFKYQTKAHHAVMKETFHRIQTEVEQKMKNTLQKQYEEEKQKYDKSLIQMISRMNILNEAVQNRMKQERKADQARELWAKCESLSTALNTSEIKPLKAHISEVKKAAVEGDEFVEAVITSIPHQALNRGVYSEDMIRDRFKNVIKVARHVARVPEGGTSLPLTFFAFLQSLVIVRADEPIPSHELANQPIDASALNNFEILERSRYWLERGDLEQTLRYMNLLQGAARAIAKDWMEESRILLETRQAVNVLKTYATASTLIYL